jgi:WD40 repeat protein
MRHDSKVNSAVFSPDDTRILSIAVRTAYLWDGATGASLGQPMLHDGAVRSAIFSRDGKRLATACGNYAQVWDAATGAPLGPPIKHDHSVNDLAFSSDGKNLVTVSRSEVRIWSVDRPLPALRQRAIVADMISYVSLPEEDRKRLFLEPRENTDISDRFHETADAARNDKRGAEAASLKAWARLDARFERSGLTILPDARYARARKASLARYFAGRGEYDILLRIWQEVAER